MSHLIDQNSEIRSKEQAARWAKDHSAEAEKIAFEVAKINNEVPKNLNDHINDGNFSTKKDLQSDFYKNRAKENFLLAIKYMPNLISRYAETIKKLTELENFTIAKEFEQKLQILKKYS
ncbi:hypothetical protein ACA351_10825 [Orientia tsutsugamushi]|uniref:hypothetical protein n=1 Tax=Orientia tsutsugamushi TaxID=784 RepID=UPI00352733F2